MITYKECNEEIKNCRKNCKEDYVACLHYNILSAKLKRYTDIGEALYAIMNDDCKSILKSLQTCFAKTEEKL